MRLDIWSCVLLILSASVFAGTWKDDFDDFSVSGSEIPDGGPGFPVVAKDRLAATWSRIKQQNWGR